MTSRVFKGISSLQEVECSGTSLKPEVKLLSLQIHRLLDRKALASLNIYLDACVTLGDFSSCFIDNEDTHKSRLKVLVDDLAEGESRGYGCTVVTVQSFGSPKTSNWTLYVRRNSKCLLPMFVCVGFLLLLGRGFFKYYFVCLYICLSVDLFVMLRLCVFFILYESNIIILLLVAITSVSH